ncbi:MAG: rhomboid family intramembrane serine protease [Candidatus Electrothrix aestuarii]|uniref:Rhomboid family intramembrane serine protease n=1 Tax=Candidatus Electrothrix aestuarii TaxID=3062594 RepID=A0AAU8LR48_9BACT|nr:rhomboid family intramembrane serine protease [Candidatus Electrothrix aestuarii]
MMEQAEGQPPSHISAEAEGAGEDTWVLVAKGGRGDIADWSLVLSAVGIDQQLDARTGVILTRKRDAAEAMQELQSFCEENKYWPPPPTAVRPAVRTGNPPTLLMFGGMIIFHWLTGPWVKDNPWFEAGAVQSPAILELGEWWRLTTALTLHADQVHLVGNCVIGGVIVHLLCKAVGYGMGWFVLLLAAMTGNFFNIVFRDMPHYSVGFSTAVFAAVGILCGRQLNNSASTMIRQLVLPLGAGVGLLAMLGSEGERTDLGAHLFGLASGLLYGLFLQRTDLDLLGSRRGLQLGLFLLALLLVVFSWLLASGGEYPIFPLDPLSGIRQ